MSKVQNIPTAEIMPGPNDRTRFDQQSLDELASSIREHGLAQPITVRPIRDASGKRTHYEIVAGERRFRATSLVLGLSEIQCIVRELSDEDASAIMLAENIGRKDLDPIDEARAYQKRMDAFEWDAAETARRCGKSAEHIRKRLKLLNCREDIQHLVRTGHFPIGHAEALSILDNNRQIIAARPIIAGSKISFQEFKALVDRLHAEQVQEAMFDMSAFVSTPAQTVIETEKPTYPIAGDLPPVELPDQHHTGAIMLAYIQKLERLGHEREAQAIGTMLHYLQKSNYVRLPVTTKISS